MSEKKPSLLPVLRDGILTTWLTFATTKDLLSEDQWDSPIPTIPLIVNIFHSLTSSTTTPDGTPHWIASRLTEFALASLISLLMNPLPDQDLQTFATTTSATIGALGLIKTIFHAYHHPGSQQLTPK